MISFLLNDEIIRISESKPDLTVLNFLREHKHKCGTKEGCASGDCGACTVVVGHPNANGRDIEYTAINSCVTFLSALHGKQLITVEGLEENETLHPVQQAFVDNHASQCGFCTPGFIMSAFALYHQGADVTIERVEDALSGNLCRCTGYRPIIDATIDSCKIANEDKFDRNAPATLTTLTELTMETAGLPNLLMPTSSKQLKEYRAQYPDAKLFAGSTDLALEVTQQWQELPRLISLSRVAELNQIRNKSDCLTIGAAVPFSKFEQQLAHYYPQLSELISRFASRPIRNQATLGGNVANASPIGDMPPVMLALNAKLVLDDGTTKRIVSAADFFVGYRQTILNQNEWIEAIQIPINENIKLKAYKVSKRFEDDISAVCAVFNLSLDKDRVNDIYTGFGGVAATPVSACGLNDLIVGKQWSDKQTMLLGKTFLLNAFTPIDDVRASAQYRNQVVANLWHRFWLETNAAMFKVETRVINHA